MKNLYYLKSQRMQSALRLGTSILLMAITSTLCAAPITRQQAQQRAAAFLNTRHGAKKLTPVTHAARLAPLPLAPSTRSRGDSASPLSATDLY